MTTDADPPRPDPHSRTPEELNRLCERAAAYRRSQLAGEGHSAFRLMAWIYHSQPFADLTPGADGWVRLAFLNDQVAGLRLTIWWEPATDRLRLERLGRQ